MSDYKELYEEMVESYSVCFKGLKNANDTVTRLQGLLRRLHDSGILDSGVPMHDPGECVDCDLVREVEKELADD